MLLSWAWCRPESISCDIAYSDSPAALRAAALSRNAWRLLIFPSAIQVTVQKRSCVKAPLSLPRATKPKPTNNLPSGASVISPASRWTLSHGSRIKSSHSRTPPLPRYVRGPSVQNAVSSHSTSGVRVATNAPASRRLVASTICRTISTFSCDIARAVSRLRSTAFLAGAVRRCPASSWKNQRGSLANPARLGLPEGAARRHAPSAGQIRGSR